MHCHIYRHWTILNNRHHKQPEVRIVRNLGISRQNMIYRTFLDQIPFQHISQQGIHSTTFKILNNATKTKLYASL